MILKSADKNVSHKQQSDSINNEVATRRLVPGLLVLTSQLLLVALAVAWCIHMILIAKNGQIYFVEPNAVILYAEIAATVFIAFFAITVFVVQYRKLGSNH